MKAHIWRLGLLVLVGLAFSEPVFSYPTGWVYMQAPYAYSQAASTWVYLNEQDTQRIYNMNTHGWTTFGQGGTRNGWVYFQWPYAFSLTQGAWYYFYTADSLWVFNYRAGQWEALNHAGPLIGTVSPVRNITGRWVGSGRYRDYTYSWLRPSSGLVFANADINATFTMDFLQFNDGSYQVNVYGQVRNWSRVPGFPDEAAAFTPDTIAFVSPVTVSGTRLSFGRAWDLWEFNYTTDLLEGGITMTSPPDYRGLSAAPNSIKLVKNR